MKTDDHNTREAKHNLALLDHLLRESKLYRKSADYKDLLDFVARMRNFAPFNAMLLRVQKPGLSYAASVRDWQDRFGRRPKECARPLIVLWPFGPVGLVYDVADTEGRPLPQDVFCFTAQGVMTEAELALMLKRIEEKNIEIYKMDAGDRSAGAIRVVREADGKDKPRQYRLYLNQNHPIPVQFTTLAHELAHLCLGHIGPDDRLNAPNRRRVDIIHRELEAESVAYIICARNGIESKSQVYLASYMAENTTIDDIEVYQVMRAAGHVETLLGLARHTTFKHTGTTGE